MKIVSDLQLNVSRHAGGLVSEFWKFAAKGNVFDLAVAVVLGNAFSAFINAIVADVAMPLLSIATGNIDLNNLSYTLRPGAVIGYGHLLQVFINFVIIALSIFLMFKLVTTIRRRVSRQEEAQRPESTEEQKLLIEIRDILKEKKVQSETL